MTLPNWRAQMTRPRKAMHMKAVAVQSSVPKIRYEREVKNQLLTSEIVIPPAFLSYPEL